MRLLERIPIILNKIDWKHYFRYISAYYNNDEIFTINYCKNHIDDISDYWKQNQDLRLTQVLISLNIISDCSKFYLEEVDYMIEFKFLKPEEILFWGTFGKNGKDPVKYLSLNELESDHIQNILLTQKNISAYYRNIFKKILRKRKLEKLKNYEN